MQEEGSGRPADKLTLAIAHRALPVGDLTCQADNLAPEPVVLAFPRWAHRLGLELQGGAGPIPTHEGGIDGEVHTGIEK